MVFELFSNDMKELLSKRGFKEPTMAQKMGIPEIFNGSDVLIIAPTGIGKTEAAMLPILDKIHNHKYSPVSTLYITPLKSLNRDLLQRLFWWGDKLDVEIGLRHGDTSTAERKFQIQNPPDILITTPETLEGMITSSSIRKILSNVKFVVIDEIHEIVGSKRGVMLSVLLERLKEISGDFQRIGLSATVGSQEKVAKFLSPKAKIIKALVEKDMEIKLMCPKVKKEDREKSEDLMVLPKTVARIRKILELSRGHSTLIFTNTRETAETISSRIKKIDSKFKQDVHHGSLSKDVRIKSEENFKKGNLDAIVCTSSLELGIDIGSIDLVIQYLSPKQTSKLVQRVGRAGHSMEKKSNGIIISGGEDVFESLVLIDHAKKGLFEDVKIHENALDVLTMSIMGMAIEEYEISAEKVFSVIKRAYPYRNLNYNEFMKILKFMSEQKLIVLKEEEDVKIIRRRKGWKFYFENLSTIPDTYQYKIIEMNNHGFIGTLDEKFVSEYAGSGETFIVKGVPWKIVEIKKDKIYVTPSSSSEGAVPSWEGEMMPVSFNVAQDVGRLKASVPECKSCQKEIEKYVKSQKIMPTDKKILIEDYKDYIIIHAHFGSKVNETIGKYLQEKIGRKYGGRTFVKTGPYRIIIKSKASKEYVEEILMTMKNIERTVKLSLEKSSLFKWRFIHNARRMGLLSKNIDYRNLNIAQFAFKNRETPVYDETMRELYIDKIDFETAKYVSSKISSGDVKIEKCKGLTYAGELGLIHQFGEILSHSQSKDEEYSAIRNRIMNSKVRVVCMSCGQYSSVKFVKDLKEPECPICKSRQICILSTRDKKSVEIWGKKFSEKKLSKSEAVKWKKMKRISELIMAYGMNAIIALVGRKMNVKEASTILSSLPENSELIKKIINYKKNPKNN